MPLNRVANTAPGVALIVLGVLAAGDGKGIEKALGVLAAIGVALAIRGYNLSASIRQDELTVHGFLRTRTIRRDQIVEITDSASVIWIDSNDHRHRTPVLAFNTPPRSLPNFAKHHSECRRRLQHWARKR